MANHLSFLGDGTKRDEKSMYDKAAISMACMNLPRSFYGNEGIGIKWYNEPIQYTNPYDFDPK